jgi:hypothetical protein
MDMQTLPAVKSKKTTNKKGASTRVRLLHATGNTKSDAFARKPHRMHAVVYATLAGCYARAVPASMSGWIWNWMSEPASWRPGTAPEDGVKGVQEVEGAHLWCGATWCAAHQGPVSWMDAAGHAHQ